MGMRGEYARALTCARDGMDIALDLDAIVWQDVAHIAFGKTHHDCFALSSARMHFEQARQLGQRIGSYEFFNMATGFLAPTLVAQGDARRALAMLDELIAVPADLPRQGGIHP